MKGFLEKENLLPRVICVILACCLWLYVMGEQNPIVERSFVVNLEQHNLAAGMMVFNAPGKVNVRVRAARGVLGEVDAHNVKAYINLENMKVGQHTVTVNANFPQGEVVEISPKVANIFLDVTKEKLVPVTPRIVGIPAQDLTLGKRSVTPSEVKIKGPAHRVDTVDKVIAPLDVTERKDDFSAQVNAVAVSSDGVEMPDIVIEPALVSVEAKMVKQMVTVDVPIQAKTTGSLASNLQLVATETVPKTVQVTASPSLLEHNQVFSTLPIDISKMTGSNVVQIPLSLPAGVISDVRYVEVRFSIVPKTTQGGETKPEGSSPGGTSGGGNEGGSGGTNGGSGSGGGSGNGAAANPG
jgi:YbbR domain-containing protein